MLTKLFFAGTDTEIGKTYVASLCAARLRESGRRVGVYKPVASGCLEQSGVRTAEDAVSLWEAAGKPRTLEEVCPQRFLAPLAPPQAAAVEGRQVDSTLLRRGAEVWESDSEVLIIEGAGGLFSPLADDVLNVDLARQLGAKLVVVAANRLGVIHQVLSTCRAAEREGLPVAGLFLSRASSDDDPSVAGNASEIAKYLDVPILGCVSHGGSTEDVTGIARLID